MANTLNLGTDGQWATKENSLLSYNDENGNYKPLPFDFTRASSATVVNKAGLIETVGTGIPRIDFLGNTNGALKLEPQRTNLVTYSEDFSNPSWATTGSSIVADSTTSPDGTLNADNLIEDTSSGVHKVQIFNTFTSVDYSASIRIKPNGATKVSLWFDGASKGTKFDLSTGTIFRNKQCRDNNIIIRWLV